MSTGENEQGLRKIIDMTRLMAIVVLLLHFYYSGYEAFSTWGCRSTLTDRLLRNISGTGLFHPFMKAKLIALGLLIISLIGAKGRKEKTLQLKTSMITMSVGLFLFLAAQVVYGLNCDLVTQALSYMAVTSVGFIFILSGGTLLSRIIQHQLNPDIFNKLSETFPQEERLIANEYSINLSARYNLKGKIRNSWINLINPFRGLLVMGTPGSGKSYFIIEEVIRQHLEKGFSLFVYDFKYNDLTRYAYAYFLANQNKFSPRASFYVINFDDLQHSHRCNPLALSTLHDITDAAESARTLMLGLNKQWIEKQGDFFVESPINFVTALIWFLRCYQNGKYCTLPHMVELAQVEYSQLFSVLRTENQIEGLINPFITAYQNDAREQLEGQIASAKISLAKLSSPSLYFILTGNDFTLDINNPAAPKVVCLGNNPAKSATYGAVLSLYIIAMTRLINRKGGRKCSLIFDEFPTIYFHGIEQLLATARSNLVATTLAVQDISQLKFHYGKDLAEVIVNIVGNIISGQVSGDSAKWLSERFGKIMQGRESISTSSRDTSISHSMQLDLAVPPSTISSLSSGEFVGIVADNPSEKIKLKTFHAVIQKANKNKIKEEVNVFVKEIPIQEKDVLEHYRQVKKDIYSLIDQEIGRMLNTPELETLIIRK